MVKFKKRNKNKIDRQSVIIGSVIIGISIANCWITPFIYRLVCNSGTCGIGSGAGAILTTFVLLITFGLIGTIILLNGLLGSKKANWFR